MNNCCQINIFKHIDGYTCKCKKSEEKNKPPQKKPNRENVVLRGKDGGGCINKNLEKQFKKNEQKKTKGLPKPVHSFLFPFFVDEEKF